MLNLDDPGRAEGLHAAMRARDPQVATSIAIDEESGYPHVQVTYGYAGPWVVRWDGTGYGLRRGSGPWTALPADAREAADALVKFLRSAHVDEDEGATD